MAERKYSLLKLVVTGTIVIVAIFLIFPLFLSNNITINASIEIQAPAKVIYSEINNIHKQKAWDPFPNDSIDTDSIPDPAEGIGAQRIWIKGDTILRRLVIKKSEPYRYVEAVLLFGEKQGASENWSLSGDSVQTNVNWDFHVQDLSYPFGRWLGIIMQNSMQPALENGLKRLRKISEYQTNKSN
ncbi:MAG: hypothetical protein IH595_07835 [Bacteroidales bacterium]|nr:hypothetical protein [Bacteroidales bacterium]